MANRHKGLRTVQQFSSLGWERSRGRSHTEKCASKCAFMSRQVQSLKSLGMPLQVVCVMKKEGEAGLVECSNSMFIR